jgi:Xaa-Pro aminopeptidase
MATPTRLKKLRGELKRRDLDGIIISHFPDIRYLSGFSGSAGILFVTAKEAYLLTDGRYTTQASQELPQEIETIIDRNHFSRLKEDKLIRKGMRIGFQDLAVTVAQHASMGRIFKKKVDLVAVGGVMSRITSIKTAEEIASIRKAANIAAKVYREVLAFVKPGMAEREVAAEMSYRGKMHGAEGDAFDFIVASGPRSALPHGRASDKKIRKGELVTLDFGFTVDGLNCDMTRTFAVGEPGAEARHVYETVLRAEREGVKATKAGLAARDLDAVCRDIIDAAGYGYAFTHSTGHGLGIDVHEHPGIAKTSPPDVELLAGMVVTIEPGIYLPGQFGVRIEDDVLIEAEGCRELTSATRQLIVV